MGQLALDSARMLGAHEVIAIDREPYRLEMAAAAGCTTINVDEVDVRDRLQELTAGRGPDKCIEAVGLEATHGAGHLNAYDRAKQAVRLETDRPHALRQPIVACRSGGTVSVIGVYGGFIATFPVGSWMNRSITQRTGRAHVHRYLEPLLRRIETGDIDPTRIVTHRLPLEEAPRGYELFKEKQDRCEKVVLTP